MLIGEVFGKTGTIHFSFKAYKDIKRLDFVTIKDEKGRWILGQVIKVESESEDKKTIVNTAYTKVIGFRNEEGMLMTLKRAIRPNSLVYTADKKIIQDTLKLTRNGLYMGLLDANKDTEVYLNPKDLVSKHLAVLASTGAGKSYTVGVILEELLEKKIPIIILDPHGEYVSLRFANDNEDEIKNMEMYNIKPKGYNVMEYSPDPRINPGAEQLTFSDINLEAVELQQIMPSKTSNAQMGLIYTAIRDLKSRDSEYSLSQIISQIDTLDSPAKWNIINMLDIVKDIGIFSETPTQIEDLVKPGQASIINLRGISPEIQGMVAYKLTKDLFELRKIGRIPPLFLILEEAHNFCPEREVIAPTKIIRTIASEGRKFGMGLCVISQRPARVDKSVLSQCNTQIILKITNPNDIKAVSYAEGMLEGMEKEIKSLNPGTALILGMELPLFVDIRVRRTRHGGVTVNITDQPKTGKKILSLRTVSRETVEQRLGILKTVYYPCYHIISGTRSYLFEGMEGNIIYYDKSGMKQQNIDLDENETEVLSAIKDESDSESLIEKTTLSLGDINLAVKNLTKKGYVSTETNNNTGDEIIKRNSKSHDTLMTSKLKPEFVIIDGELIKPKISGQQSERKAKAILGAIDSIKLIYYPYYLGKNFMVDAVTGIKKNFS
ncbi:MAG: ATP-binding protein [DPANN group archaeon]|nr:ATP-binding protein [DPANN group archaeon]